MVTIADVQFPCPALQQFIESNWHHYQQCVQPNPFRNNFTLFIKHMLAGRGSESIEIREYLSYYDTDDQWLDSLNTVVLPYMNQIFNQGEMA